MLKSSCGGVQCKDTRQELACVREGARLQAQELASAANAQASDASRLLQQLEEDLAAAVSTASHATKMAEDGETPGKCPLPPMQHKNSISAPQQLPWPHRLV